MSITKTSLWDRRAGEDRDNEIEAELHRGLSPTEVIEAEKQWGPIRRSAVRRLLSEGHPPEKIPQHYHWDWASKAANLSLLSFICLGVRCDSTMQGLMMLNLGGHFAKVDPDGGKPIVYISYLETAPWNLVPFVTDPRFGGVGTRLFQEAVRISEEEGFHGRVGLHSLPQTESFYATSCGMTPGEPDPAHEGLRYYELTRVHAKQYLHGA